jgi:tetratricopeptide (TPR) repeat protein
MSQPADLESDLPLATDGDIAVTNLESAREQSWSRFWRAPERAGIAEGIVEQEALTAQFLGDLAAFDRLEILVNQLVRVEAGSFRVTLIQAQLASMTHRFDKARGYLAQAALRGAPERSVTPLSLSINQACGTDLQSLLRIRRRMAAESGRLEDLVPLGALLADLGAFEEADRIYRQALRQYQDVSPFALAWACFQLGTLWGELVPQPQTSDATRWYRQAIEYLPCYVKARVHLAEIYLSDDHLAEAEGLLIPALSAADPEVNWRLADVLNAAGRFEEAEAQLQTARFGFETLLQKQLLAFADHGAEFYSGSGNDAQRALELARINVANRATLRAFEQAHTAAVAAGEPHVASDILLAAGKCWGGTSAFELSPLVAHARSTRAMRESATAKL